MSRIEVKSAAHFRKILQNRISDARIELGDKVAEHLKEKVVKKMVGIVDQKGNRVLILKSDETHIEKDRELMKQAIESLDAKVINGASVMKVTENLG